ncbi:hypothetical protein ADEAN_000344000 [Angomonas deanei]|uniref:Uncharacterized protein n=1 Tax=Angomonas deanei TaxID=59799 RepID=A0A7G2CCY6_9TRYP|nr:hypothetical protein ADEAN_000344000 [Angomonas deanei]
MKKYNFDHDHLAVFSRPTHRKTKMNTFYDTVHRHASHVPPPSPTVKEDMQLTHVLPIYMAQSIENSFDAATVEVLNTVTSPLVEELHQNHHHHVGQLLHAVCAFFLMQLTRLQQEENDNINPMGVPQNTLQSLLRSFYFFFNDCLKKESESAIGQQKEKPNFAFHFMKSTKSSENYRKSIQNNNNNNKTTQKSVVIDTLLLHHPLTYFLNEVTKTEKDTDPNHNNNNTNHNAVLRSIPVNTLTMRGKPMRKRVPPRKRRRSVSSSTTESSSEEEDSTDSSEDDSD